MYKILFLLGIAFNIGLFVSACSSDKKNTQNLATPTALNSAELQAKQVLMEQKPLLIDLIDQDCKKIKRNDLWKPKRAHERESLAAFPEVKISKKAFELMTKFNLDISFYNRNIQVRSVDLKNLFHFELNFNKKKIYKACIWEEDTTPPFDDPKNRARMPLLHISISTPDHQSVAMGQQRFTFYAANNYFKVYPDQRKVGRTYWYGNPSIKRNLSKSQAKKLTLNSQDIANISLLLADSGFDSSESIINEHFNNKIYSYSPYSAPALEPYFFIEKEHIFLSDSDITKLWWRNPQLGPNSWPNLRKIDIERAFAITALLSYFYKPLLWGSITPNQEELSQEIPKYPTSITSQLKWLQTYHLISTEPRLDYFLFEKCSKGRLDDSIKLYCSILEKHLVAKNLNYNDFINKKFSMNTSYQHLGSFLTILDRLYILDEFKARSREVAVHILSRSRDSFQANREWQQQSLQSIEEFQGSIDKVKELLVNFRIQEAKMKGLFEVNAFLRGTIDEKTFERRMNAHSRTTKKIAYQEVAAINNASKKPKKALENLVNDYTKKLNLPNPFEHPWDPMAELPDKL